MPYSLARGESVASLFALKRRHFHC